jgi:hypothetical protein
MMEGDKERRVICCCVTGNIASMSFEDRSLERTVLFCLLFLFGSRVELQWSIGDEFLREREKCVRSSNFKGWQRTSLIGGTTIAVISRGRK